MARITCKTGVTPPLLWIAAALSRVEAPVEVTITAGDNGVHMVGSLHYKLRALDLRTKNFPDAASKAAFVAALKHELGPGYDLVYEHQGEAEEHLHVEYDPKIDPKAPSVVK